MSQENLFSSKIDPMLGRAIQGCMLFKKKDEDHFHFWPLQQPRKHLAHLRPLRKASDFHISFALFNYAENVPFDSDDTSLGHLIYGMHQRKEDQKSFLVNTKRFYQYVDEFRDQRRRSVNFYNLTHGRTRPTGAFLTWFKRERGLRRDFVPKRNEVYLPIGANDLDCVVNANILRTLAFLKQIDLSFGVKDSCRYLNRIIKLKDQKRCGMYYPNSGALYLAIASAFKEGAHCSAPSIGRIKDELMEAQKIDGHWNGPFNGKIAIRFIQRPLTLWPCWRYTKEKMTN